MRRKRTRRPPVYTGRLRVNSFPIYCVVIWEDEPESTKHPPQHCSAAKTNFEQDSVTQAIAYYWPIGNSFLLPGPDQSDTPTELVEMVHVFTSLFGHTTKYITSKKPYDKKALTHQCATKRRVVVFSVCLPPRCCSSCNGCSFSTYVCIAGETDAAHTRPHLPHLYDVFFAALAV